MPCDDRHRLDLARRRADEQRDLVGHRHHLEQRDAAAVAGAAALVAADGLDEAQLAVHVRHVAGLCEQARIRRRRLAARPAHAPGEPLADDAVDRRREDAALDVHVGQPLDRRRRRLGVQRRQDQVAGHRGAKGDLGRFLVADLADEQHVRVRAQHRPQAVREREPGPRVDLDLVEAVDAILDGILDRRQLPVRRVEDLQAGEERRRLAGARRPDDDDGAERLRDRPLERCVAPRRHAERSRATPVPLPARGSAA